MATPWRYSRSLWINQYRLHKLACASVLFIRSLIRIFSMILHAEDTLHLGIKNKQVYFVLLSTCTIFAMSVGRNPPSQESILFKSKTEIRQNFQTKDGNNKCSFCFVYVQYGQGCRIYTYQNGRGNIVSSMFVWLRRLAMPLFYGRKTTSLTSFLFLYPFLFAIVRRLALAKKRLIFRKKTL